MTLVEMMIVVTLIALVAGISYPSVTSGIETLQLRSAADSIVSLLNTSLERADRRGQPVEILISPREGTLVARSADAQFLKRIEIAKPLTISDILPHLPVVDPEAPRRVIVYPGGAPPRIGIELSTPAGRKRKVMVDPVTGVPLSQ